MHSRKPENRKRDQYRNEGIKIAYTNQVVIAPYQIPKCAKTEQRQPKPRELTAVRRGQSSQSLVHRMNEGSDSVGTPAAPTKRHDFISNHGKKGAFLWDA
jgi:hypothetical protein